MARPGELVSLRALDIDTSATPWEYRPAEHKGAAAGRERIIFFGPKARQVLSEFMIGRAVDKPLFSPREAEAERRADGAKGQRRPGQKPTPKASGRKLLDRYSVASYAGAIAYGCEAAEIPRWTPNRLRHNAQTEHRRIAGIDTAAVIAGHAHGSKVTAAVYAEADREKAKEIIERVG